MPKAMTNNIAGHRSKYELLAAHCPAENVGQLYVGASDPIMTGYHELEVIRRFTKLEGGVVVDIGCGIGRLTQHIAHEPVRSYLGIDIIPEIMKQAEEKVGSDQRFSFKIADDCKIPLEDGTATAVVAFSVITHLIDEEVFDYLSEARRVLVPDGVAIFSFLDFFSSAHQELFFKHASQHRHGHGDMLKFTTEGVLRLIAERVGFSSVQFINGDCNLSISGAPSKLLDVQKTVQTFRMGQSLCAMRV